MFVEATSTTWQSGTSVLVVVGGLIRLWSFIRRRRNPVYHNWQPAEVIALRSVVLIVTGKPVTPLTWKRIDMLLLAILVVAIVAGMYDYRTNDGRQSPLRRLFGARPASTTSAR
jgi:hypothetical protein